MAVPPPEPVAAPQTAVQTAAAVAPSVRRRQVEAGGSGGGPPSPPPPETKRRKAPFLVAAALAVGIFGAIGLSGRPGTSQGDPPPPPDVVAAMQAEWAAASAVGVELHHVAPAEQQAAIQGMTLSDHDKDLVKADVDAGRAQLVQVEVWDSMDEDGDTVELSSGGMRQVVVLRHIHTVVTLPMPRDGIVHLRGVRDGAGGGITVGIRSGGVQVRIPPMTPGQELNVPVR